MTRRLRALRAMALICLAAVTAIDPASASTGELSYVSDEELAAEIERRKEDIVRTQGRVATLALQLEEAEESAGRAQTSEEKIEEIVVSKMRVFYKLTRYGGSLRLLLGSREPTELLFRLRLLERLLSDGLQARRQAGLRVVEATATIQRLSKEQESATRMLEMLQKALSDLLQEQKSRARR